MNGFSRHKNMKKTKAKSPNRTGWVTVKSKSGTTSEKLVVLPDQVDAKKSRIYSLGQLYAWRRIDDAMLVNAAERLASTALAGLASKEVLATGARRWQRKSGGHGMTVSFRTNPLLLKPRNPAA